MKNESIADLIYWIHIFLLVFVIFGPYILTRDQLPYHIILCIVIMLDWNDIDGMCYLTKLETYFRRGEWISQTASEGGPEFFRPFVNQIFGWNLDRQEADRVNYIVILASMLVSFVKYWKRWS